MSTKVLLFQDGSPDKTSRGGKGASLAQMTQLGLPVPPGFTITADICIEFLKNGEKYPTGLWDEVLASLKKVEKQIDKEFGNPKKPLLVSVRSGAAISMPGMMDTLLNVGLNDEIAIALGKITNNTRFVKDSYRRLIFMFSNVVCGLNIHPFEDVLEKIKQEAKVQYDHQLTEEYLDKVIEEYKILFKKEYGEDFPQDPIKQLDLAVQAVFKSWNNKRAIAYREYEGIPDNIGTAVNIQSMVFGNYDNNSGTGVMFTRNPASGINEIYGEYLMNAQGEDVVAGLRTPIAIATLKSENPQMYKNLEEVARKLENHYKDMQDIEFTIQENKLYMLQTRTGKRTGAAAAKIAKELVESGMISKQEAVLRITSRDVESSLFPSVVWKDPKRFQYYILDDLEHKLQSTSLQELIKTADYKQATKIGEGLPAGPGAATGHVVFDSDMAEAIAKGQIDAPFEVTEFRKNADKIIPSLILIKKETSPEDFHGMVASSGIITMTGGMTSHAALVGRQIGKRVIVGASTSKLDLLGTKLRTGNGDILSIGDVISMEVFEKGLIFHDKLPIYTPSKLSEDLEVILDWADEIAKIKVRANADKENDTQVALDFKTTGTGLARTEHMFFDSLDIMQDMILSDTKAERQNALNKMIKIQREDFVKIFTIAKGKPITIRLLDPPLHEFLPKELEIRERTWTQILNPDQTEKNTRILRKVLYYQEANPMLGLRGCRLGLLFPEVTQMQVRAILEAALEVKAKGIKVDPEIMIPLIGSRNEFLESRKIVDETAKIVFDERKDKVDYMVGTMIEIPRAALTADEIAEGKLGADFFSFGTNDLHQMTLGFSRDDIGKFLPFYLDHNIIESDPFQTIDESGVGKLMEMCVELGRKSASKVGKYVKIGICGEQGGDPKSIDFCYRIGLDYVSCSPFRVPVARLAAAHATLKNPEVDPKYLKKN